MTDAVPKMPVTFAQYVAAERTSEVKHQLVDGEVFDMSGGTPEHAALIAEVITALGSQLRGRPCRAYSSDLRIRVEGMVTYPDASVVCGRLERDPEDESTILNPTVIVEVLSDSTEAFDRGRKAEHYRKISSLREYVLVDQHEPHVEAYRRTEQGWMLSEAGRGGKLRLESIECALDVDAIYEGVFEQVG